MNKKKIFFAVIMLVYAVVCKAQDNLSQQQLIEDFNTYIQYIEETHPDSYTAYGGRVEFKRAAQNVRSNITQETSRRQFREMLSTFISQLGDGHTTINNETGNESNAGSNYLLSVTLKTAADGIFIAGATETYKQYVGAKIVSINGLPIDKMLEKVRKVESTENKSGEYIALCQLLANDTDAGLLFEKPKEIQFTLKLKNNRQYEINIPYIEKPEWIQAKSDVILKNDNRLLYGQIVERNKQSVGYFVWNGMSSREMLEEVAKNNPQYLDMNLNSMYNSTMKVPRPQENEAAIQGVPSLYAAFTDLLKTMQSQEINHLIIDLRENGGGMTPLCYPLLYMLYGDKYLNYNCKAEYNRRFSPMVLKRWGLDSIEQYNHGNGTHYLLGDFKFDYFFGSSDNRSIEEKRNDLSLISYFGGLGSEYTKNLNGKPLYEPRIIVLTSPKTFSAAYHFMYFLTQIGQATVVGVPPRQAGNTFMETTSFELPNTHITGSISNSIQLFFPDDPAKGKIYMPDYIMNWNDYAKYNFDENAEILYVLDLIKTKKI